MSERGATFRASSETWNEIDELVEAGKATGLTMRDVLALGAHLVHGRYIAERPNLEADIARLKLERARATGKDSEI